MFCIMDVGFLFEVVNLINPFNMKLELRCALNSIAKTCFRTLQNKNKIPTQIYLNK